MFITPSFKKSLIVEQFQGNYLNPFPSINYGENVENVPLRCRMSFRMKLMVHFPVRNFIIWLGPPAAKMNQIARRDRLPERARWSHLARSGIPAVSRKKNFPESHIINPLLTKFFRSRWLDIGLVLFLRVYGPRRSRGQ